jgi:ketosteroid isomerase-like protein
LTGKKSDFLTDSLKDRAQAMANLSFVNDKSALTSLALGAVLLLAFGALSCAAQEKKEKEPRQKKLLAARQVWYDAYSRGDTEAMARIEAKDFVVISERGTQSKDKQLRGIRQRVEEKKWPKGATHVTDDRHVRFYGNSAVVTGHGWMKFPDQKDPPKDRYVLTEVWVVDRDGAWNVVHLHFSQLTNSAVARKPNTFD